MMSLVRKIKYRDFFEGVKISDVSKNLILDLLEQEHWPKFNHFKDYFSFINGLDLGSSFSVTCLGKDNLFKLSSDTMPKTYELCFLNNSVTNFYEKHGCSVEDTYNIESKELIGRHFNIDNSHCYVNICDSSTDFLFEVIPGEDDNVSDNSKYKVYLTLNDLVFDSSHTSTLLPALCDELFSIAVTDLSFLDVIELHSSNFKVRVEHNSDILFINKVDNKYSLFSAFKGENTSCSFKTKQESLTSLKKIYSSFLKPFI